MSSRRPSSGSSMSSVSRWREPRPLWPIGPRGGDGDVAARPCHILGTGDPVGVTMAAFANGSFSQALEYDDTHLESIVHMSSPSVAAALALAELSTAGPVSGRDLITAIAIGNEISCRVGSVSPGQFHRLGFHPSGLFAPFGVSYLAGQLLELDAQRLAYAAGIVGSFAAGLLECWVDGTQPKFLHPGWAAQSGISAAFLARAGTNGPGAVFEGRFGLYASHLQDRAVAQRLQPDHRRPRQPLGFAQRLVQAVPGGARDSSLHRRVVAGAEAGGFSARRRRAHRLSGGGLHRADRLRAARREAGAGLGLARPREPAVHAGRGTLPRRAGEARLSAGEPGQSGDPRAGGTREVSRRSGVPRPGPFQGRGAGHAQGWPVV